MQRCAHFCISQSHGNTLGDIIQLIQRRSELEAFQTELVDLLNYQTCWQHLQMFFSAYTNALPPDTLPIGDIAYRASD